MIHKILTGYQIAEAKNQIPAGSAVKATFCTVLEAGIVAFHKGYFGDKAWNDLDSDVKANRAAYEAAGALQESLLTDVTRIRAGLREAQTSTDFPVVLANIRNRVVRGSYNPVNSVLWDLAEKRTTADFKLMKGVRVGTFDGLTLRPEGEDVDLTKVEYTEDGYAVANYEKGVYFTWEMWRNDDLGVFSLGLKNLGKAANRTRGKVVLSAIKNGVAQTTPTTAGVGGPTIARLSEVIETLADRNNDDGTEMDFGITDIAYPAVWALTVAETLKSQYVLNGSASKNPSINPVFGIAAPHEDRMMKRELGKDWLIWDNNYPWLEVATLSGFEAGPKTYTKMPDVIENPDEGSFDNHSVAVKFGDAVGAMVTDDLSVIRVKGE